MDFRNLEVNIRQNLSKLREKYNDSQSENSSLRSLYGLLAEKSLAAGVTSAPLQGTAGDEAALRMGLLVTQYWYGLAEEKRYAICEALVKAGVPETDLVPEWRALAGTDKGALVKEDDDGESS